jgi:hypothetical protein
VAQQEVAVRRTTRKVVEHPQVGRLELQCDVVLSVESGQRLVLFRAQPAAAPPSAWTCCAPWGPSAWTRWSRLGPDLGRPREQALPAA